MLTPKFCEEPEISPAETENSACRESRTPAAPKILGGEKASPDRRDED